MKSWTRREFGRLTGAALLTALGPPKARGQVKARVVAIGGGIGGATVARYLAASATAIDVTLVEPRQSYMTCFFSNLYLAGLRPLESLNHGYEALTKQYGITVVHEFRRSDRPGGEDRRAEQRFEAQLRPSRRCAGHRIQGPGA